ncbi:hypothetical protein ACH5RR_027778 [Cinchona calisaya]|uniref:Uncharacterized protein n=1 Tax=Cinchona calisaya TaxID=153742 RepID=A0ABD2YLV8_9GENT
MCKHLLEIPYYSSHPSSDSPDSSSTTKHKKQNTDPSSKLQDLNFLRAAKRLIDLFHDSISLDLKLEPSSFASANYQTLPAVCSHMNNQPEVPLMQVLLFCYLTTDLELILTFQCEESKRN